MNTVKLILTDLDDTLLTDEKVISRRSIEAFEACRKAGIETGFATARSEVPVAPYVKVLRPRVQVLNSGGLVLVDGKVISKTMLTAEATSGLLGRIAQLDGVTDICVETDEGYYCNQKDIFKFGSDYSHSRFNAFKEPFLLESYKLTIHMEGNEDALFALAGEYEECQSFSYAAQGWCCIQPKGVSKGNGARIAADYLGIPLSEVAAFGDDVTDLELLRDAGIGVAMENAIPSVADAAAYHTLSNQADGVAYFIENHILRKQSC